MVTTYVSGGLRFKSRVHGTFDDGFSAIGMARAKAGEVKLG